MSRRTYKPETKKVDSESYNSWNQLWAWIRKNDNKIQLLICCTILGITGVKCNIPYFIILLIPVFITVIILVVLVLWFGTDYLNQRYEEWHRKYFDLKPETTKEQPGTDLAKETIRSQRNKGLAGVIGLVMKADGVASKAELEGVASYLKQHYKSADFEEIMKALKVNLKINNPNFVKQSCNWLTANMSHSERLGFCEFLFDIARLSQGIAEAEWKLLFDIMNRVGLEDEYVDYLSRKYATFFRKEGDASAKTAVNSTTAEYLRILGLDPSATTTDIQAAYRTLAKRYHPDTVQDEEMKLVLTEKFKEISLAYSFLTK